LRARNAAVSESRVDLAAAVIADRPRAIVLAVDPAALAGVAAAIALTVAVAAAGHALAAAVVAGERRNGAATTVDLR